MSKCREAFEAHCKTQVIELDSQFAIDLYFDWQAAWNAATKNAVLEAQGKQEPVAWMYYPKGVGEKYVTYTNPASLDLGKQGDQIAFIQPLYAAPVVQPDRRRLHNDIAEVVAKQLHYFDNVEKINGATTAKEVSDVLEGGIDRYRNDAVFHAKVCSLVAHLTQVIAAAEWKSNAVADSRPD